MTALVADRVKESTLTAGTASYALNGASLGFRAFSDAFTNGSIVYYCCENGADWEVGEGTYSAGIIARTNILSSSNANTAVNWPNGNKTIFCALPAESLAYISASPFMSGVLPLTTAGAVRSALGSGTIGDSLFQSSNAFQSSGLVKSGYVVASKAEGAALSLTSADAGRKIFITSSDGGEFTVEYNSTLGTYSDNGGTYCGTVFIPAGGNGTIGIVRNYTGSVNALWFGAKGDGITDDKTAFQNAANYAVAGGFGALYIPKGTFILASAVSLPAGITVFGDGSGSILKAKASTGSPTGSLIFSANGSTRTDITLRDFVIDGNKNNVAGTQTVVTFFQGARIRIKNVAWQNCKGISLIGSNIVENFDVIGCTFTNCGGNPNGIDGYRKQAIVISNDVGLYSYRINISQNKFDTIGLDCISIDGGRQVIVENNISKNSGGALVYTQDGCSNMVISGNYGTSSTTGLAPEPNGIDLRIASYVTVSGNVMSGYPGAGIGVFDSCSYVDVIGNVCINNRSSGTSVWMGGICIGAGPTIGTLAPTNVAIKDNICIDDQSIPTQQYGIYVDNSIDGLQITGNYLRGNASAPMGWFVTKLPGTFATLSDATPLTLTSLVVNHDQQNQKVTNFSAWNTQTHYQVAGVKVVGPQETGWTAGTGTANKGAFATYAGQTVSAAYVQAEAQATDNAAKANSQRIKAIEDALRTHGLIN